MLVKRVARDRHGFRFGSAILAAGRPRLRCEKAERDVDGDEMTRPLRRPAGAGAKLRARKLACLRRRQGTELPGRNCRFRLRNGNLYLPIPAAGSWRKSFLPGIFSTKVICLKCFGSPSAFVMQPHFWICGPDGAGPARRRRHGGPRAAGALRLFAAHRGHCLLATVLGKSASAAFAAEQSSDPRIRLVRAGGEGQSS